MTKYTYYTNDQISDLLKQVIRKITLDGYQPNVIVGLSRGGLDIGVKLSHYYNVPFEPLQWQTRDGQRQDQDALKNILIQYHRVLVVDDIFDSGLTIDQIDQFAARCFIDGDILWDSAEVRYAVLIENIAANSRTTPHWSGTEIDRTTDSSWICFPWENWWAPSAR
jgi:hypoxanthine phosphoribosyltransferase